MSRTRHPRPTLTAPTPLGSHHKPSLQHCAPTSWLSSQRSCLTMAVERVSLLHQHVCVPLGQEPTHPSSSDGPADPSSSPVFMHNGVEGQPISPAGGEVVHVDIGIPINRDEGKLVQALVRDSRFLGPALPLSPGLGASTRPRPRSLGSLTQPSSSGTTAARHPWLTSSPCCLLFPH